MKKILLTLLLAIGITMAGMAQTTNSGKKFSIGLELGRPTTDGYLFINYAIGGSVKYNVPIGEHTAVTFSGGYTSQRGKDGWSPKGFIPLKAGLKYNLIGALYAEGQAGAVISAAKSVGTGFAGSGGVGYAFNNGLDIGLRYENWDVYGTIGQIGLRIGFGF
ncbi:hypothetical protein [Mucilaginibacter pedocola]|uniref:Outer membrane protein beta-barrel domain-containing protein n=1 Tax=Mucilaginibacter pedocola TaxID=1792845 RepID=A0A1S9PJ60_9SPHI|nr:hypothetical protein [Mucilaginibacter pedocola]OOQ60983.1 hypothetical protein BC343_21250 [Mucilaginibacter pedocola]